MISIWTPTPPPPCSAAVVSFLAALSKSDWLTLRLLVRFGGDIEVTEGVWSPPPPVLMCTEWTMPLILDSLSPAPDILEEPSRGLEALDCPLIAPDSNSETL